uniref:Ribulose bisphosphate carboxylase small subunit, chloroplastic n=2 Tax=Oryza punctata TaxID=4537 RepID=A0A0E0MLJ3_ORYPU
MANPSTSLHPRSIAFQPSNSDLTLGYIMMNLCREGLSTQAGGSTLQLKFSIAPSKLAMAPSVMASSATSVAPFQGLKSTAGLPVNRRSSSSSFGNVSNGGRIRCMQVWPIEGIKKFETLSYLPPLTVEDLLKQIEYLLRSKWVPCLEFSKVGFVYRENHRSPGYYDGRYWTMWKLPMFGCSDATQVLKELEEAKKAYPDAFVRIIGFDNVRQVQCISFIAYKPPGCEESGGN